MSTEYPWETKVRRPDPWPWEEPDGGSKDPEDPQDPQVPQDPQNPQEAEGSGQDDDLYDYLGGEPEEEEWREFLQPDPPSRPDGGMWGDNASQDDRRGWWGGGDASQVGQQSSSGGGKGGPCPDGSRAFKKACQTACYAGPASVEAICRALPEGPTWSSIRRYCWSQARLRPHECAAGCNALAQGVCP